MRPPTAVRWLAGCFVALMLGQGAVLLAQGTQPLSSPAACPPSATLDQLITALDAAVSGPANKDRTCMRQLLLPQVRLIPVNAATASPRILSLDDWIAAVAAHGAEMVTEKQIKVRSQTFGNIAHLWSTYETALAGKPATRGINSIQAINDGQNWKIIEIVWQVESPTTPIPARDLP